MPLAKSNIETRSRQGEFRVICTALAISRNGRRSAILPSAKSLFLPPKDGWKIVRLHVPGPSSGEDTVSGILQGDVVSLYLLEVQLTRNAVVILDTAATKFFLRDFNLRTRSLWNKKYMSLERRACCFQDEHGGEAVHWLYQCSCNKGYSDRVAASGPHINMLHEGKEHL
ncbi:hypothetical protein ABFA07_005682 [Porites harrisoni]